LTRHVDILRSEVVKTHLPLMAEAVKWVAHAGIRNRGTIGGSVAYADPSAELPACIVVLNAVIVVQGPLGKRQINSADFFDGLFSTLLQPNEIIIEFLIPAQSSRSCWAFLELSRRHGDFAMAGLAVTATISGDGVVNGARVVYFGCTDHPVLAVATATSMLGASMSDAEVELIQASVEIDLQLEDTPGYRADTKLRLAKTLTKRALRQMRSSLKAPTSDCRTSSTTFKRETDNE
jgi:aerobic carbon-monoxide dehydrogenase medium subunit